ncbi:MULTISPECIES: VWA domain-containing protein [Sorangium]|uniref:vWA domain-containing protein n=1 Tax=Sorangium TaxID=39643 RepID=UPI001F416043|nr:MULTISPECIES: vWA domain-containing protein [Sorangium]
MSSTLIFPRLSWSLALVAAGIALSCSGTNDGDSSSQGSGASSGISGSGGGATSSGGATSGGGEEPIFVGSGGGLLATSGNGGAGGSCQQLDIAFEPQTPTVMIVVDRSGSMYDSGFWEPLKTAVLNVVESLQAKVRFGFLTFTGIAPDQCPLLAGTDVIALNSHADIAAAYEAASMRPGQKLETPTGMTFNETIIPDLLAFAEPGPKYILFVTDGEPDRCDDGPSVCARDDVVGAVQSAYRQGIGTFVFGLGDGAFAEHLQDLANAGAGQPVRRPQNTNQACFTGAGTYADVGGTAMYYTPDPTNANALENELNAAISGAKSCTFDLQGSIAVDLDHASEGQVLIDGVPVPYDAQNGWTMESPTQLTLVGDACEKLKAATQGISFNFPCEIIDPL